MYDNIAEFNDSYSEKIVRVIWPQLAEIDTV